MPADPLSFLALTLLILAGAVLYSSGGHAGASAYLAAMALFGVAPEVMKPTALLLNIVVAVVGATRFVRAGAVPWSLLRPLCLGSIPAAFLGGRVQLPAGIYLPLLGACLLFAAMRLWLPAGGRPPKPAPPFGVLVALGVALGFLAGVTGIGGGIFLSPLVLLAGWEEPRRAGGAAVVFILANSVLGLLGHASSTRLVPPEAALLGVVALSGGLVGSWFGVHRFAPARLRRIHAVVLVVSGVKLLFERG